MKRFNLSAPQQQELRADIMATATELLQVEFADPKMDEVTIRRHAYLRGKIDALQEVVQDNYPDPEEQQQQPQ